MIGVVGAGAFGTALAIALADEDDVSLWARDGAEAMEQDRSVPRLQGVTLTARIRVTGALSDLAGADAILFAVPAQATAMMLHAHTLPNAPRVFCAKGIDRETLRLQHELDPAPSAILTGPGFADEIAAGKPTALTLAAPNALGEMLQDRLARPHLRLYRTTDVIGAALGGALKNVYAIACGITAGLALGESARAALMTRGFAEMRRLARAMGAEEATLAGLSGFGDLALTCNSPRSRNFRHGQSIGAGAATEAVTTEGIATARAAMALAQRHRVEMPIAEATARVLERQMTPAEAMAMLLARPVGYEM